jgi:hypothetical protein
MRRSTGGLALGDHLVAGFVELDLEEVDRLSFSMT